ncbi:MAG: Luciferase-like monooxygenase, partial [Thermomicrobiales bacterium]|nr:Luciferase-like monooxygenase [Thermomicrobiales bacterium]
MGTVGYAASMEQFAPSDLLRYCQQAEDQGFTAVMASDHFNPWVPSQGESGFVWSFMGALGALTNLRFGPGVTPPGYRYHPAIIAQAAATLEEMYPGRFYLGLGAGEALNEHIVAEYWPEAPIRLERLMESIEIIGGPIMAYRTGKFTDGIITVGAADEKLKMLMERFETGAREAGKDPATMPKMLQVKVSYAPTVEEATERAVKDWPNGG